MRIRRLIALAIGLIPCHAFAHSPNGKMDGLWKLVLIRPFQEVEFLVMEVSTENDAPSARVTIAQKLFKTEPTIEGLAIDGDSVRFTMTLDGAKNPFRGTIAKGDDVLGTLVLRGKSLPARLERTVGSVLDLPVDTKVIRSYYAAREDKDASARWDKLQAFLLQAGDNPRAEMIFLDLLSASGEAKRDEAEVRSLVDRLQDVARPYGNLYLADVRSKIVKALVDGKSNAALALQIAQDAEKALPSDASPEAKAASARDVASAARALGKADLAAQAETRAKAAQAEVKAGDRTR